MSDSHRKILAPTIPSEFVFEALEAYKFRGFDSEALLREVGLEPAYLSIKGNRLSVVDYSRVIEKVIFDMSDGFLGFLDEPIPTKAFSVCASLLAASRNVTEAIICANRFYALFTDQFQLEVQQGLDETAVVLIFEETQNFDYRFIYQSILLMTVRLMHWFIGEDIKPESVTFSFEQSQMAPHLSYLFGCKIHYSKPRNAIHIHTPVMTLPCTTNLDQINFMLRDTQRLMLINSKVEHFTAKVRQALILNRETGWLTVEESAQRLGFTKNLLWRKLRKEGASFLQIRDDAKRDWALDLVEDLEMTVNQISEKLGFADTSSFCKAFINWTGQSPAHYRTQMRIVHR